MPNMTKGFADCDKEYSFYELAIQGKVPNWLNGVFLRNGPGKFHAAQQLQNHWFDGLAMLQRFKIHSDKILYSNLFIRSKAFLKAEQENKNCYEEFSTLPKGNFLQTIKRIFFPLLTDNTNVNIAQLNGQWVALTETTHLNQFDVDSLNILGEFHFNDQFPGMISTAHPHYDSEENAIYNFNVSIGLRCYYHIYKISSGNNVRTLLAKIPTKAPAYMHSFAITQRHIILVETPLRMRVKQFIFARKPYIENYAWNERQSTQLTVIDKHTGKITCQVETEPFFMFHQINAFEQDGKIIIDLPVYENSNIINQLYLDKVCNEHNSLPMSLAKRLTINITNKTVQQNTLIDDVIEFPNIHYQKVNGKPYQYFYACSRTAKDAFFSQLKKVDISYNNCLTWKEDNCYPGEPIFVANPAGIREDDGVILSVVLDVRKEISFLLILNATDFSELARAELPHALPFGLHGQFIM